MLTANCQQSTPKGLNGQQIQYTNHKNKHYPDLDTNAMILFMRMMVIPVGMAMIVGMCSHCLASPA
ncbi:MAG: hypothetical protein A2521_12275 [Deltaproteobacteria bacterium RIFOXYD12_FULL_57_12]|nr:MAG: hypothetical protein A2521_12275 [Deltaproteobacteria bacterium RIFOXYD12_FULL_57_12]